MSRAVVVDPEQFAHRLLQDAFTEATAAYWLRRAETFAAVGNARCDEIARACRNRATLATFDAELIDQALTRGSSCS